MNRSVAGNCRELFPLADLRNFINILDEEDNVESEEVKHHDPSPAIVPATPVAEVESSLTVAELREENVIGPNTVMQFHARFEETPRAHPGPGPDSSCSNLQPHNENLRPGKPIRTNFLRKGKGLARFYGKENTLSGKAGRFRSVMESASGFFHESNHMITGGVGDSISDRRGAKHQAEPDASHYTSLCDSNARPELSTIEEMDKSDCGDFLHPRLMNETEQVGLSFSAKPDVRSTSTADQALKKHESTSQILSISNGSSERSQSKKSVTWADTLITTNINDVGQGPSERATSPSPPPSSSTKAFELLELCSQNESFCSNSSTVEILLDKSSCSPADAVKRIPKSTSADNPHTTGDDNAHLAGSRSIFRRTEGYGFLQTLASNNVEPLVSSGIVRQRPNPMKCSSFSQTDAVTTSSVVDAAADASIQSSDSSRRADANMPTKKHGVAAEKSPGSCNSIDHAAVMLRMNTMDLEKCLAEVRLEQLRRKETDAELESMRMALAEKETRLQNEERRLEKEGRILQMCKRSKLKEEIAKGKALEELDRECKEAKEKLRKAEQELRISCLKNASEKKELNQKCKQLENEMATLMCQLHIPTVGNTTAHSSTTMQARRQTQVKTNGINCGSRHSNATSTASRPTTNPAKSQLRKTVTFQSLPLPPVPVLRSVVAPPTILHSQKTDSVPPLRPCHTTTRPTPTNRHQPSRTGVAGQSSRVASSSGQGTHLAGNAETAGCGYNDGQHAADITASFLTDCLYGHNDSSSDRDVPERDENVGSRLAACSTDACNGSATTRDVDLVGNSSVSGHADGGSEPDQMVYLGNGNMKIKKPDDGTVKFYFADNGSWHIRQRDGSLTAEFPSGQKETHFPDGSAEIIYSNGTIMRVGADGSKDIHETDGTHISIDIDGTRTVRTGEYVEEHTPHHIVRRYPDGGTKKVFLMTRHTESVYPNGRIRLKDSQGNLVYDSGVPQQQPKSTSSSQVVGGKTN